MSIESRIVTAPKSFKLKGRGTCLLGSAGSACCHIENAASKLPLAMEGALKIEDTVSSLLDSAPRGKKTVIRLSTGKAPEGIKNADQGYSISVKAKEIELVGFGELGLYYACVTLCQLLRMDGNTLSLPCLEILDYPDIEKRGHYVECRYGTNLMELSDWKQVVDDMVEKKQNTLYVALYGCWSIQYDNIVSEYVYYNFKDFPKIKAPVISRYYSPSQDKWVDKTDYPPMYEQNFFGELVSYGRQKGVEVAPFINSYGHNTLIPAQYPEVSAKFPDGTPTYNGLCTSNPKTYELLFKMYDDIIDNVLKPNGITSFDIGLDEVGDDDYTIGVNADTPFKILPAFCHCKECEKSGKTPIEKLSSHAVKLTSYLKSRGMKSVCMYSDMYFRKKRPPEENYLPWFENILEENDLLDTAVLGHWTYPDLEKTLAITPESITDRKTRTMLKPMNGYYHWNIVRQSVRNSYIMAKYANMAHPEMYVSYSGWDKSYDRTNSTQATLSWSFEKSGDLDACTRSYAERLFPNQAEKAAEGIKLLDAVNEEKETGLSTRILMEKYLPYYFYSYLRRETEYPQNYPGRAVKTLLSDRANCEKVMNKVARDAKRAEKIFTELSRDPSGDMVMAERYAAESAHYLCLVRDFSALLHMYDLSLNISSDALDEMRDLAKNRICERTLLMKRFEEDKEQYLIPSQLRNMSIILQFMRDLSAYLETATPDSFDLNFEDFTAIASEQFKKLR